MTRPRKSAACTRRLLLRLTEEQRSVIRAKARAANLSVSEYVRRMAVDGQIVVRQQSAYGMALASQLKRIGVNLNQLTHIANSNGEMPPELVRLCGRIEILLDRVMELE